MPELPEPQVVVALIQVLERARDLGFFGPGPVERHLAHAELIRRPIEAHFGADPAFYGLDLGSGGGLPGLVLATWYPHSRWVLLDANLKRTDFLRESVNELGLEDRVGVVRARAEVAATDEQWRERFDLVTARSFAPPPVTAECAVPFLVPGQLLMVSEPPDRDSDRWPSEPLGLLGLELVDSGPWAVLRRVGPVPAHLPRREGAAAKRPAW